jgi:hypothetical protein
MGAFDPRLTPARADLAARTLEGKVKAPRYVDGRVYEVIEPQAALRAEPEPDAPLSTEALKGERVTIYDIDAEGWAWGQLAADGYVGWLPANALVAAGPQPTHKVAALRTLAFPGPSIKLPPIEALPLGARLHIVRIEDRMAVTRSGAYVPHAHLAPFDRTLRRHAVSMGRQDRARPRLLGAGAGGADGVRHRLSARQRHAGAGARLRRRRPRPSPACG